MQFSRGSDPQFAPAFPENAILQEINSQVKVLLDVTGRQTVAQELMKTQLSEQAQHMLVTMKALHDMQAEVSLLRKEIDDMCNRSVPAELQVECPKNVQQWCGNSATMSMPRPSSCEGDAKHPMQRTESRRVQVKEQDLKSAATMIAATITATLERSNAVPQHHVVADVQTSGATHTLPPANCMRSPPGLTRHKWTEEDQEQCPAAAEACVGLETASAELFNIVAKGETEQCMEAIRCAQPEVLNMSDSNGMTVLHCAAIRDRPDVCVAILSRRGFRTGQAQDRDGNTALHIAARRNLEKVCHAILSHDLVMVRVMNRSGDTPLDIAHRFASPLVCAVFDRLKVSED